MASADVCVISVNRFAAVAVIGRGCKAESQRGEPRYHAHISRRIRNIQQAHGNTGSFANTIKVVAANR